MLAVLLCRGSVDDQRAVALIDISAIRGVSDVYPIAQELLRVTRARLPSQSISEYGQMQQRVDTRVLVKQKGCER